MTVTAQRGEGAPDAAAEPAAVPGPRDRLGPVERGAAALLLVALAAPFWVTPWLPFLDLPQHVGLASVLHHFGDPAFDFQRFYALDLRPLPYWGFYLPVHLLAYALPVAVAAKVVLTGAVVALPPALASLLGAFGRDRRLAVFAVPLALNKNLFMGFTSFVVALPVWVMAVAAAERWLARPAGPGARRRAVAAGAWAAATYLAHGQAFLLLVCAVGLLWIAHGPRLRSLWPFAPAGGLLAFWLGAVVLAPAKDVAAGEHLTVLGGLGVPGRVSWNTPGENLSRLGDYLFDAYAGATEDALFLAVLGLLGVLAVVRPRGAPGPGGWLVRWRLEWMALGLLLSYFVSPMEIGLQWYVNPRHLILAALLATAFPGPAPFAGWRRWLLAPAVALALAVPLQAAVQWRAFRETVGPFAEVVAAADRGGRTLGLVFDNGAGRPVRTWPLLHFPGYLQAARGGDLGFSFAGLPSIPVRYREGMQAPHPYEWRPETFRLREHGPHYDRILVRGPPRGDARRLGRYAGRVVRAGPWTLFEELEVPAAGEAPPGDRR